MKHYPADDDDQKPDQSQVNYHEGLEDYNEVAEFSNNKLPWKIILCVILVLAASVYFGYEYESPTMDYIVDLDRCVSIDGSKTLYKCPE